VQSAFMIDLNQVSLALRNATARSLILLDEFGKGTAAAGSCLSLNLPRRPLVLKLNRRFVSIRPILHLPFSANLYLIIDRRCGPLCWSLETSACPRLRLPKSNSHDALSRAVLQRRRSRPPKRAAHHFRPHGDHVCHAWRRDHR
jgi:MutS domain V